MRLYRLQQLIRPDLQAHIYSQALLENVSNLRSLCRRNTRFCAVIKANAYGHGITEVVNILKKTDVEFLAVSSAYEAIHILDMVKTQTILILEPININQPADQISLCAGHNIHCVISSLDAVEFVGRVLADSDHTLDLHVNVESGMGRCGLAPKLASALIERVETGKNTRLAGVFTHFATADEEDISYDLEQLNRFNDFLRQTNLSERKDVIIHAANSAATIKMPEAHFDMVRCGISMYGYYSRQMADLPIALKPVMKLQAPIVDLKKIPAGDSVSYGRSFVAERNTTVAIIPLGYADGYLRCFSNRAKMKVGNSVVNVIGRVCMDQLLIDVTDVPGVALGQMATVIDNHYDSPCGVYALAELADTICYEILTCMHAHVNRIVH